MSAPSGRSERIVRMELAERTGAEGRGYDVVIGRDALVGLGDRLRGITPAARKGLLVADGGVPDGLVGKAVGAMASAGIAAVVETVSLSERAKSLASVERLLDRAVGARLERREPFVALGGGIVGDVAGFAAAIYRRGVPVVQCPTTLLAMVDASVGGKTGVNLGASGSGGLRKNMAGCFWQPSVVLCDLEALESLPEREYAAGLAECLKHALIGNAFGEPGLLDWMMANVGAVRARDERVLAELIARNVGIKARVVAGDEREERTSSATGRAALNAGHTVAHAIEAAADRAGAERQSTLHGEAVALGLIAETAMAEAAGVAPSGLAERIGGWVRSLGLPERLPGGQAGVFDARALASAMADDKKVEGGKVRLFVPTADRGVSIVEDPSREAVLAGLMAIGARG